METLDKLNAQSTLKEEIERIKDAVMLMDYDGALSIMRGLLK